MYYIVLSALSFLMSPLFLYAAGSIETDTAFVGSLSLWVAIVIGTLTSLVVLRYAYQIGSQSLLGRVFLFFAAGMLVIVFALVLVIIPPWNTEFIIARVHDLLFVMGFGLMATGAGQMLRGVGMKS